MSSRASILKRFDELIAFGNELCASVDTPFSLEFLSRKARWQTSCLHILEKTFGATSIYSDKFKSTLGYTDEAQLAWEVELMRGAKEEIEKGFLYKIEHLMSIDLFDSVLEQADYLLKKGFKDVAAILGRVIIEKTLMDIAKREHILSSDGIKLSDLNQLLKEKEIYAKNIWRVTQGYIDLGNYAAHGDFDKYDDKSVGSMLTWIRETLLNL